MLHSSTEWRSPRQFLFRTFFLFVLLFVSSFVFGYQLLPDIGEYTHRLFEILARFTGDHIFSIRRPYTAELISDSTGFYINSFNILLFAITGAACWGLLAKEQRSHDRLLYWFTVFVRYYLALQLLIYGFSKIFKAQFYLPEPNILFTPLGQVPKDLLYWSTIGVSAPYSIFLGATEVIAAVLLLFRRTMLAGAFFAFFILLNITAINFAYDISVKLLSCFLLGLTLFLLSLHRKRIARFFSGAMVPASHRREPAWENQGQRTGYYIAKTAILVLLLLESCWLYIKTGNFNDDVQPRSALHGAYDVDVYLVDGDTIPPLPTHAARWKRVFFHRHDYFIVQGMNEEMFDFEMELDTAKRQIDVLHEGEERMILTYYQPNPLLLILEGNIGKRPFKAILRRRNWGNMPLLKKEFNWTID